MVTRKATKMPEKPGQPAKTSHAAQVLKNTADTSYFVIGLSKKKGKDR
jgi:hypothetical protein